MPPNNLSSPKAAAEGHKERKSKAKELSKVTKQETKKQINKVLSELNNDITKQIMDLISKMINKPVQITSKKLFELNKMMENIHDQFYKDLEPMQMFQAKFYTKNSIDGMGSKSVQCD